MTSVSHAWRMERSDGARDPPRAVAGRAHVEHPTGQLHQKATRGDHCDGREPPFGLVDPFQQLGCRSVNGKLALQLPDPTPCRGELGALTGESGVGALIDPRLLPPAVHGLVADAEVVRDVSHSATSIDEVKNSLANSGV